MAIEQLREELNKTIAEIKDYLKDKDTLKAEVQESINKATEELTKRIEALEKEVQAVKAERQTPAVSEAIAKDLPKGEDLLDSESEEVKSIHKVNDSLRLVYDLFGSRVYEKVFSQFQKIYPTEIAVLKDALGTTSAGDAFVPVGYSRTLFEEVMLKLRVAQLHERFAMPHGVVKFPVVYQDQEAYYIPENVDESAVTSPIPHSRPTTGNIEFRAKKLASRTRVSAELEEDSIIPMLPLVKNQITDAIARAIENAIINGDVDGTLDSDNTEANDPRRAFNGYRKIAIDEAKIDASGSLTVGKLTALQGAMDKYGIYPEDVAYIVSPKVFTKHLLTLKDEAGNQVVLTHDKLGSKATILTGQLGQVFGIPIIVSQYVRQDLNASGVYDGTTTGYSIILLVHKRSFLIGYRRELKVVQSFRADLDQRETVATVRIAFGCLFPSHPVVGILYNIPV